MKCFMLEIDELATLVGFLNARKLVGLDEGLFRVFTEENLPNLVAKLNTHGWIHPAERPGTWHLHEELMQTLAVAVAPKFAVLARSLAHETSIVFYGVEEEITEIVVTDEKAVVARLAGLSELVSEVMTFLRDRRPGEIGVARVKGETFDAGRRATVDADGTLRTKTAGLLPADENAWSAENVDFFVRGAMAELTG